MKVSGKIVLVTGASSGIGEGIALEAARRGARGVALLARREAELARVAQGVKALGAEPLTVPCDVADDAAVLRAVEAAGAHFGGIDVAIANAGTGLRVSPLKPDQAGLERLMNINFLGAARLFHAVLPEMLSRGGGQIVGVSSLAGYRGMPFGAAYCSAKGALTNLLESYRLELAETPVKVSVVLPGFVPTPMTAEHDMELPFPVPVERAAVYIWDGIEADRPAIAFPPITALLMFWLKMMPIFLFDRVMKLMMKRRQRRLARRAAQGG